MRSRVPTGVNAPPARSPGANGAGLRLSPPSPLSRGMMLPVETGELRPSEGAGERRLSGGFSCKLSTKSSKTLAEAKGGRGTKGLAVGHPHGGSPASDSLHTLAEPVERLEPGRPAGAGGALSTALDIALSFALATWPPRSSALSWCM